MGKRHAIVHPEPRVIEVRTDRSGKVTTRYDPVDISRAIVALAELVDRLGENLEELDLVHPIMEAYDWGDEMEIEHFDVDESSPVVHRTSS